MNHRLIKHNYITIIYILLASYFIFLLTAGIGILQYGSYKNLDFLKNKYEEFDRKYNYLINNMSVGDIEDNNREILYLEEMKCEILESVNKEGEFWLVELKNLIDAKQDFLLKNFIETGYTTSNLEYLKLKNEIDEYSFYYSLGKKPIDYLDGIFIKYFIFLFNSKGHQFYLTFIILSICYLLINDREYVGFIKTLNLTCVPVLFIQVFHLVFWLAIDNKIDILYPIRIIENFNLYSIVDFDNIINDRVIPLYLIILNVILLEMLYIVFIVSFIKIIDLVFTKYCLKILGVITFLASMFGMLYTKYSSISFFAYGKFLDIIRGYESVYKGDVYLNIKFFSVFILCVLIILNIIYFFRKYFFQDSYMN